MQKTLLVALLAPFSLIAGIPSLADLSLDEKIGQLFVVATTSNPARNADLMAQTPYQLDPQYSLEMIENHHVGGIIFLGAAVPDEQVEMTNQLQGASKTPLLIAQDAEWGLSMRHQEDVITYPRAMTLGALSSSDDDLIYKVGQEIGRQCREIEVLLGMQPVVDVNNESENPIINMRSFGENQEKVAKKTALFMKGLQSAGRIACAKHWPGHGNTKTDSHHTLPVVPYTKKQLEAVEFIPFKYLIERGVQSIMTAHLAVPQLAEEENMPATFSHNITTKLLREELGFKGLIITDGLGMKGVTEGMQPGEPELKALQAGHDILLCPVDVERAIERIKQAIKDGSLTEKEIDEHVERILQAKRKADIKHPIKYDKRSLQSDYAKELKARLYQAAITLARNENRCLPLKNSNAPIPVITNDQNPNPPFLQKLRKYLKVTHHHLDPNASYQECKLLEEQLKDHPQIITSVHIASRSGMIEMHHTEQQKNALPPYIELIKKLGKRALLVLFGNPYNLAHMPDTKATIVAYENEPEAQVAAAETVVGTHNPRGKLPVTASPNYPEGHGLNY